MKQMILGISEEHDAGIFLLGNGTPIWGSNEERYTRKKLQTGTPTHAIATLSQTLHLTSDKPLTASIAVGSLFHVNTNLGDQFVLPPLYFLIEKLMSATMLDFLFWGTEVGAYLIRTVSRIQQMKRTFILSRVLRRHHIIPTTCVYVDHHEAHAYSTYMASGWKSAFVLTLDASGDGYCSRVFTGKNGKLYEHHREPMFHSPGYYYAYVTTILGFKLGREGKVTGLAAHGDATKTYPIFLRECSYDVSAHRFLNHGAFRTAEIARLKKLLHGFSREDISAGIQKHLEMTVTAYIADMIALYGNGKPVSLAVAGGVFANVRLNQKIAALGSVKEFFIYPHMGDGGLAAGAAYARISQMGGKPKKIHDVYLGDSISKQDVQGVLREYKDVLHVEIPRFLAKAVAQLLSLGNVVAVVQGKMEYGPRALGHRTLLSQATDKTVNDWLNKRLKRSEFMPFAPLVLARDIKTYFTLWKKVLPSLPYMTVTVDCTKKCQKEAPAIVHVDNTARPQIVRKETSPFLYDVMVAYRKKTGKGILINTSYNIHEEPIVRTAKDAVKTFLDGHIDALVLGDTIIALRKKA